MQVSLYCKYGSHSFEMLNTVLQPLQRRIISYLWKYFLQTRFDGFKFCCTNAWTQCSSAGLWGREKALSNTHWHAEGACAVCNSRKQYSGSWESSLSVTMEAAATDRWFLSYVLMWIKCICTHGIRVLIEGRRCWNRFMSKGLTFLLFVKIPS